MIISQKASGIFGKFDWKDKGLQTSLIALLCFLLGFVSPVWGPQLKTIGSYALSGAIANWLALFMLFEKVPGLRGSGLITLKFEEFKSGIHKLIMQEFITRENLARAFKADGVISAMDREILFEKLLGALQNSPFGPMLGMFGGVEGLKKSLRQPFEQKIEEAIRELVAAPGLMDKIETLVQSRLDEFTPEMFRDTIEAMSRSHLSWLVVWGGGFGAIVGLVVSFL